MSLFGSTSFLGKIWAGLKSLFVKTEEVLLPEAITITEAINNALKNQSVDDLVAALSPKFDGIPETVLTAAQGIIPKIMAAELGLQALQSGATPQDAANWAQSVIAAFAGINSNITASSKIWTDLAASLAVLFDQGKTANKTWIYWANLADQAFQKIQAAITTASQSLATTSTNVPANA